jgi:uncharacterized protein YndB with AHSA1/START domain
MLKKILVALAAAIAVLLLVVATRPDDYKVVRTAAVAAPPEAVFAAVADFHRWEAWSPWGKLDPAMKTEYTGAPGAPGSSYYWTGNDKVGEGRMTIERATPPSAVTIKLEFMKPFASVALTDFTVKPAGAGSEVSWAMSGKHTFMSKAMCLVKSMDAMIGPDFERGLAQLKQVAESAAKPN